MITVAIDFREATKSTRAGKGEYVYQLAKAWLAEGFDSEMTLLTQAGQTVTLPPGRWRQKMVASSGPFWHWQVAMWLRHRPVDVYLSTQSFVIPAISRAVPVVTTLFDFTAWRYPKTHLSKAVRLEKLLARRAIRRSAHLLAISEFTKRETVELFGVAPGKITVTPMAAGEQFKPLLPDPAARAKYHLPEKFILYLGTIEPRKNLSRLIDAFGVVSQQFPDVKLVLAGGVGWQSEPVLARADDKVIFPGYILDRDRPAVYNLATVFVFPSLYEGFGIPPLEAMACGIPTIVSDRASLPEVVDGAAALVPAEDITALADAMSQLLSSSGMRETLKQAGIRRAREFSWQQTARLTWEAVKRYG